MFLPFSGVGRNLNWDQPDGYEPNKTASPLLGLDVKMLGVAKLNLS